MSQRNKIIWVLSDDQPGNYLQAIGLAEKLIENCPATSPHIIQIKKIHYNFFAKLPNLLNIGGLMAIIHSSKTPLLNLLPSDQKPSIIISAGRKTAPIAAFLKNYYQAFAIQIMNPNWNLSKFDVVILPSHDKANQSKNIIRMIGSLTRVSDELLVAEYQKFSDTFGGIDSPKIALLVGGSSKKGKFSTKIAKNLGDLISDIAKKMNGNLLILNSRRTGAKITEILDQNLHCNQSKIFFKWKSFDWQNPYFAVLQAADFIIATGDSISMCSEICSTGKPVYIFNHREICSAKHLKFHQDLFDQGFARKLDEKIKILENYSPKKLVETARIAHKIIENLSQKRL